MRFLIIEDQQDVRKLLQGFLKAWGNCDQAEDGIKGIAAIMKSMEEKQPYDVVFLDIMMPKMAGQDVLKKIRELEAAKKVFPPHTTKIIMTTALDDKENIMEAFREQADAYLVKPILRDKILDAFHKAGVELPT